MSKTQGWLILSLLCTINSNVNELNGGKPWLSIVVGLVFALLALKEATGGSSNSKS